MLMHVLTIWHCSSLCAILGLKHINRRFVSQVSLGFMAELQGRNSHDTSEA